MPKSHDVHTANRISLNTHSGGTTAGPVGKWFVEIRSQLARLLSVSTWPQVSSPLSPFQFVHTDLSHQLTRASPPQKNRLPIIPSLSISASVKIATTQSSRTATSKPHSALLASKHSPVRTTTSCNSNGVSASCYRNSKNSFKPYKTLTTHQPRPRSLTPLARANV